MSAYFHFQVGRQIVCIHVGCFKGEQCLSRCTIWLTSIDVSSRCKHIVTKSGHRRQIGIGYQDMSCKSMRKLLDWHFVRKSLKKKTIKKPLTCPQGQRVIQLSHGSFFPKYAPTPAHCAWECQRVKHAQRYSQSLRSLQDCECGQNDYHRALLGKMDKWSVYAWMERRYLNVESGKLHCTSGLNLNKCVFWVGCMENKL